MAGALARRALQLLNDAVLRPADLILLRRSYVEDLGRRDSPGAAAPAAPAPVLPPGLLRAEGLCEPEPGLRLWVDLTDQGVSRACRQGDYEPVETAFVLATLQPGDVFVDVGANIGWFTLKAARAVGPAGRVIAIEPRQDSFSLLSRSLAASGLAGIVQAENAAAGAAPGRMEIAWEPGKDNPGGTWSMTDSEVKASLQHLEVAFQDTAVVTLDDVVGEAPVKLMKLDIEGAEPQALAGARRLLARARPVVLCEINTALLRRVGRCEPAALLAWMAEFGYRCRALGTAGGLGRELTPEALAAGPDVLNVVFCPD